MADKEIVVGTDGSAYATAAIRWAAVEAALRGAPLRVLLAHDTEWPGRRFGDEPGLRGLDAGQADAILDGGLAVARLMDRALEVRPQRVVGRAAPALLSASDGAGMLVVGSRGHGGFTGLLLGSVSQEVAGRAACPVAVIRGSGHAGPVVVGTDGADQAQDGVELGFRLAAERHTSLLAVRAYYPPSPPLGYGYEALVAAVDALDGTTADELTRDVEPWRGKFPSVEVHTLVAHGSAAGALVERSRHARAVVIGGRGRGPVTGTLLGSVGTQLLHHAYCPVVVAHQAHRG